jgi:NADH-quinone oxidoreductase subunit D
MSTIDLIVGPQHPALHEPEKFTFKVDGEYVVDVEPRIGYVHRAVEKAAEQRTYLQDIYLTARICGICNTAHTTCFCQAVEDLHGAEVPARARYIRSIIQELHRIHSHLLLLGIAGELVGFETLFMYLMRDREIVLDLIEKITGNRVMTDINTFGGTRRDLNPQLADQLKKGLTQLRGKMPHYKKVFTEDPTIRLRFVDVGILKPKDAIDLCAVGPTIRGSGVETDTRAHDAYDAYGEIPWKIIAHKEKDSWARLMVRLDEVTESIEIIERAVEHLPAGPVRTKLPNLVPLGEAVGRVEAPRGELIHHIISRGGDKPYRLKVRTPTLANFPSACHLLKGIRIADIPAALVSIDPCFSCTDRMAIVDSSRGGKRYLTIADIDRKYWRNGQKRKG